MNNPITPRGGDYCYGYAVLVADRMYGDWCWVAPGGERIYSVRRAQVVAEIVDGLIKRGLRRKPHREKFIGDVAGNVARAAA